MENKYLNKPMTSRGSLGTLQWLFQVITGVFLVFFVGVHLYLAHINGGTPISLYDTVLNNLHNPWWLAFYIAFDWIVVYHALNGVKGIVYDMGIKASTKKWVAYILIAVYIIAVIYSTELAIIVSQLPLH
ncbi:MAG: succinate dehydrogenase [Thermoplasmataceae archaeon]